MKEEWMIALYLKEDYSIDYLICESRILQYCDEEVENWAGLEQLIDFFRCKEFFADFRNRFRGSVIPSTLRISV